MTGAPIQPGDDPRRMTITTEAVLHSGALDAAEVVTEMGATTVRLRGIERPSYTAVLDLVMINGPMGVADELHRLASRVCTAGARNLRAVVDQTPAIADLTDQQSEAVTRLVTSVLDEFVWCAHCLALVPNSIAQAHVVRTHPRSTNLWPARFYGSEDGDD